MARLEFEVYLKGIDKTIKQEVTRQLELHSYHDAFREFEDMAQQLRDQLYALQMAHEPDAAKLNRLNSGGV